MSKSKFTPQELGAIESTYIILVPNASLLVSPLLNFLFLDKATKGY